MGRDASAGEGDSHLGQILDVPGDRDLVSTTYAGLAQDARPGDRLLILEDKDGDGKLVPLAVTTKAPMRAPLELSSASLELCKKRFEVFGLKATFFAGLPLIVTLTLGRLPPPSPSTTSGGTSSRSPIAAPSRSGS